MLAYFEEDGNFYLVQEFVEGHPLTHEMPLGEWWTESKTLQFIKELLAILAFVHSQNVIHLDIKPANIIRRKHDQKLVLIDFGAVKRVHLQPRPHNELGKTQSTVLTCVGTRGYMAVEQLTGRPNLSSDIYALGMTAIQAVTGILPVQLKENNEGEIAWRDQAEVSNELADVLTKMVRRYHKQRYQSVAEVLQGLESVEMSAVVRSALPLTIDSAAALSPKPFGFSQLHRPLSGVSNIPTIKAPISGADTVEVEEEKISDAVVEVPKVVLSAQKLPNQSRFVQGIGRCFSRENRLRNGIAMLSASLVVSSGFVGYHQWQRHNHKTLLAEIEALAHTGKTEACISQALTFPNTLPDLHQQSINALENCSQQVLEEAKSSAKASSFAAAAELTKTIPSEAKITYAQAQELAKDWHSEIVNRAEAQYGQCKANNAIAALKAIPEDSHLYEEAQQHLSSWQSEAAANSVLISEAKALLADDSPFQLARSYAQGNEIRRATGTVQTASAATQSAQEKVNRLQLSGEPMSEADSCNRENIPDLSVVTDEIDDRNREVENLRYMISDIEKTPLSITADLTDGANGTRRLEVGEEDNNADDDILAKDYPLWGEEGDTWTISMTSSEFDTYLVLIDYENEPEPIPGSRILRRNDDSNGTTNSLIREFTLPYSGEYTIRASTYSNPPFQRGGEGEYTLRVTQTLN